jgi:hypothetical protein
MKAAELSSELSASLGSWDLLSSSSSSRSSPIKCNQKDTKRHKKTQPLQKPPQIILSKISIQCPGLLDIIAVQALDH